MRHADGHWVWVHDTSKPVQDRSGEDTTYFQGFLVDISARKEAEAARAQAEHRYRTMVEALPAVTYIDEPIEGEDLNATMPFVSPQIEAILGYPVERFLQDGRFWFSVMHPEDYERLRDTGDLSVSNVSESTQEYRMRHADGHWVWVQDTSRPVFDDDGELLFFQGFLMDVSTRHEAEERLRAAEQRFRVLVEQMPAAIYTETITPGTPHGVAIDYLSPQFERLVGQGPETLLGDVANWPAVIHPDDRAAFVAENERVNATGDPFSMDYRVLAGDGSTIVGPRRGAADPRRGRRAGVLAGVPHRHHRARRGDGADPRRRGALPPDRRAHARDHVPGAAHRRRVHRALLDVLREPAGRGAPRVSRRAMGRARVLGEHHRARGSRGRSSGTSRTRERDDTYRSEYRMRAADGRVVWFHDEAQLIRGIDGAPVSWQGVMIDITERREAEQELQLARERLQALIEHIPAIVYRESDDEDPAKFFLSPQVERILGYTVDEWTWTRRLLGRPAPPRRSRTGPRPGHRVGSHPSAVLGRVPLPARRRRLRVAPGRGVLPAAGPGRARSLAGSAVRRDGAQGGRGAAAGERARPERDRRAPARDRLPRAARRPAVRHPLRESAGSGDARLHARRNGRRARSTSGPSTSTPRTPRASSPPTSTRTRPRSRSAPSTGSSTPTAPTAGSTTRRRSSPTSAGGWWQGFMIDISERRAAEDQLREAEERFRLIVERGPAIFYQQEFDPERPRRVAHHVRVARSRACCSATRTRSCSPTRPCGPRRSTPTTATACCRPTSRATATSTNTSRWNTG